MALRVLCNSRGFLLLLLLKLVTVSWRTAGKIVSSFPFVMDSGWNISIRTHLWKEGVLIATAAKASEGVIEELTQLPRYTLALVAIAAAIAFRPCGHEILLVRHRFVLRPVIGRCVLFCLVLPLFCTLLVPNNAASILYAITTRG